jgi:ankyrin repeat protein
VNSAVHSTDVNMIDPSGNTPLHWACQQGSVTIVQMLLSAFARVDIATDDRRTAIEHAEYSGNNALVPYMSPLLDASNYTPSSSANVTQATGDVVVSDVSIIACEAKLTEQPCAQYNTVKSQTTTKFSKQQESL